MSSNVYVPNGAEVIISGGWGSNPISLPAGELYQYVDDDPLYSANDSEYIASAALGPQGITFPFSIEYYFAATDYTDGETSPNRLIIPSFTITVRAMAVTGTLNGQMVLQRGGSAAVGGDVFIIAADVWANYSQTITSDPLSGDPILSEDMLTSTFGISKSGNRSLRISRMKIQFAESLNVGETRARLRSAAGEPAFFCAICNLPFARSSLIKVVDPDHPSIGRLVCDADYDQYYPVDDSLMSDEDDTDREMR